MSSKQSDSGNRIKSLAVYSLLCAFCIVCGYIEFLIPTTVIAPGVKIGLSNAVALILLIKGDVKGAFAVNITRILLSALLFGSLFSLLFSFCAGVISTLVCALLIRIPKLSPVGVSVAGAVCHNTVQIVIAGFVVGKGVWFYLPVLIISGIICGLAIGLLGVTLTEKIEL